MNHLNSDDKDSNELVLLHEEVEKRYLAYALSTIVSRALPDFRDGLKPVHRRILYAMYKMNLGETSRMRKSAAVVGEVIGKYHPHGDQAAYDAMVRMAQDFSLRYPLVEGSGNFGSIDGDAPAAMRYTETKLSQFAGLLLRDIDQGTTEFRPTYDGMGEEPLVLPAALPNLLLNGASGIAVGMSCSFPPHNLREVISACRAAIQHPELSVEALMEHIKGPDFPTYGEIIEDNQILRDIYTSGHGSIRVRGTFSVENAGRGRKNIIVTSVPYSVNKSRLIERIAGLIRDKKLKLLHDVRDESTSEVRVVLELKGSDTQPETVMAFLYKHTDLQINFPVNLNGITPMGVPDRVGIDKMIRFFLDFRYEKIVLRLEHRLAALKKRIHMLEGFEILFLDLDKALKIIRSARNRQEAAGNLKREFGLDDEQVDAILEMRLYRLVGLEIGKLVEELKAKRKEAESISKDLASSKRLWKIIDRELADIEDKFGDERRTAIVPQLEAPAIEYDPEQFLEHEDVSVILSSQGWIRRIKAEVEDEASLKFREEDRLLGRVRVNTGKPVSLVTNFGKLYVMRALDVPAGTGFGEPIGSLLNLADGECVVGLFAPDPAGQAGLETQVADDVSDEDQTSLFDDGIETETLPTGCTRGILITKKGMGFRFDYDVLRDATKKIGRRLASLKDDDEVVAAVPEDRELLVVASNKGSILVLPIEQVPVLGASVQGVRIIRLVEGSFVAGMEPVGMSDYLWIKTLSGEEEVIPVNRLHQANRDTKGKVFVQGIANIKRQGVDKGME